MKYINKKLTVEKVNFQRIAKKFGTPFYCYSYSKLKENVNRFKENFKSYDILFESLKIFNEILKNVSPNKKRMLELAYSGYITATDLADYLVKNNSMSFRKAYQKTALLVNLAEKKKKKLNELSLQDLKKIEPTLTNDVLKVFDLKNSVNSKKSYGGTSFDNIKKMIRKYKKSK